MSLRAYFFRLFGPARRETTIGNRRIVLFDPSIEVRRLDYGAKIPAMASDTVAAGGRGVGAESSTEPFVFLCSGVGVKCDRIAWLKTVRIGSPHLADGNEDPIELLLISEGDAGTGYRYRILAEVYDLDTKAMGAVAPHPSTRHNLQAQSGALQEQPEVGNAEHQSNDRGNEGNHAAQPAAGTPAPQPGKGRA